MAAVEREHRSLHASRAGGGSTRPPGSPGREAQDITGWHETPLGILRASRQFEQGYHLEFARRAKRRLGESFTIIDPVDYTELRGTRFYDLFIDRSHWPRLIEQGYEAATQALDSFRPAGSRRRAPAAPSV